MHYSLQLNVALTHSVSPLQGKKLSIQTSVLPLQIDCIYYLYYNVPITKYSKLSNSITTSHVLQHDVALVNIKRCR